MTRPTDAKPTDTVQESGNNITTSAPLPTSNENVQVSDNAYRQTAYSIHPVKGTPPLQISDFPKQPEQPGFAFSASW